MLSANLNDHSVTFTQKQPARGVWTDPATVR